MKKILTLAIAAALTAPVAVMADATVYGKIHAAIDTVDDGNDTVSSINSHDSRVGVKGSEDLGDGLKAVYQLEFAVDTVEDGAGGLDTGRNQYVGLAGGFGTALIGRHDTPLKMSQGKFDVFGDTVADIKAVMPGEDRLGNVLAYVSPSMGGFTGVVALVSGEEGDAAAVAPGDDSELTGIADHYSLAGMYSNGPFYGALAYNGYDLGAYDANPSLLRATFVYSADMFSVGAMYSDFDYDGDPDNSTAWGLSGAVKVGPGKIKAQYLQGDNPMAKIQDVIAFNPNVTLPVPGDDETTQWTVGYDYGLSKRTSVYALYNNYERDSMDDAETTFSLGMVHNF